MSITPINVNRVSQNLRSFNLLTSLRANQVGMFGIQNQLATGLRFQTPSQDPLRASDALRLDRQIDTLAAVNDNLRIANNTLREGESAMQDAVNLMRDAYALAIETASDTSSADERASLATVVDSIIEQTVAIGNRRHLGTFLFSGHFGADAPFELIGSGVLFKGDNGRRETIVDSDLSQDFFTISGQEFFNALSGRVQGKVDLDPALNVQTRLSDLNGASGAGIASGGVVVSLGTEQTEIDLTSADTVGDVIDLLNANLPQGLSAALGPTAITISGPPGAQIMVDELPGGRTASDLGLRTQTPVATVLGADLDPRVTERTQLTQLFAGSGLDVASGLTIRNGTHLVTFDFSTAQTMEDLLNAINFSDAQVVASVNPDGRSISIQSRLSGAPLSIEENGGDLATRLGVRSMAGDDRLSDLNDGKGVTTVEGEDFRIVTASGVTIDIDVDDLDLSTATLTDLLDLINAQALGAVTASLAQAGNGIVIQDNTSGGGTLQIQRLNVSPAIDWLGLDVQSSSGQISGRDVHQSVVDSPFTALLDLKRALEADDAQAVGSAAQRLQRNMSHMQEVQGRLAAQARMMLDREVRVEAETTATQILQSDTRDVDLTEALVRFQQLETALQASLQTSARVANLSLIDFLQ